MRRRAFLAALCLAISSGTVSAHQGVQNAAVLAWMENMKQIGAATKVLGTMAKGQRAFDAEEARSALSKIERLAAESPALFDTPESDPKSEALPAIWENWDDFTAKSDRLETVAAQLQDEIDGLGAVRAGLGELAATCKACHAIYRE